MPNILWMKPLFHRNRKMPKYNCGERRHRRYCQPVWDQGEMTIPISFSSARRPAAAGTDGSTPCFV